MQTLAQTPQVTSADTTRIIIWSLVLMAILIAAFVLITRVKRRMKDDVDPNPTASSGFTLADLRQMHRDGLISAEELEKAKAKIVEAARRPAAKAIDEEVIDLTSHEEDMPSDDNPGEHPPDDDAPAET